MNDSEYSRAYSEPRVNSGGAVGNGPAIMAIASIACLTARDLSPGTFTTSAGYAVRAG